MPRGIGNPKFENRKIHNIPIFKSVSEKLRNYRKKKSQNALLEIPANIGLRNVIHYQIKNRNRIQFTDKVNFEFWFEKFEEIEFPKHHLTCFHRNFIIFL